VERPAVLREVSGVTLISYGKAVHACTAAAEALEALGISAEVLDLS
jgi:pyruvate/2-oxoglutarate/acetoin dehydrogenase E1 component